MRGDVKSAVTGAAPDQQSGQCDQARIILHISAMYGRKDSFTEDFIHRFTNIGDTETPGVFDLFVPPALRLFDISSQISFLSYLDRCGLSRQKRMIGRTRNKTPVALSVIVEAGELHDEEK